MGARSGYGTFEGGFQDMGRQKISRDVIENLAREREDIIQEIEALQVDINRIESRREKWKIFQAGELFKEAGILDSYDKDEVLALLKKLRRDGL